MSLSEWFDRLVSANPYWYVDEMSCVLDVIHGGEAERIADADAPASTTERRGDPVRPAGSVSH